MEYRQSLSITRDDVAFSFPEFMALLGKVKEGFKVFHLQEGFMTGRRSNARLEASGFEGSITAGISGTLLDQFSDFGKVFSEHEWRLQVFT